MSETEGNFKLFDASYLRVRPDPTFHLLYSKPRLQREYSYYYLKYAFMKVLKKKEINFLRLFSLRFSQTVQDNHS